MVLRIALRDAALAAAVAAAPALAVVVALWLGQGLVLVVALALGVLTPIAVAGEGLRRTASRIGIGASSGVVAAAIIMLLSDRQ
jgi:hypothetical protein